MPILGQRPQQDNNKPVAEEISRRPPPRSTDFARATTRFMIAARDWVRANHDRAVDALKQAVVAWSGVLFFTAWKWSDRPCNPSGGTAEKPGWGRDHEMSIADYAARLTKTAAMRAPKGQLACIALGRSRYGGSFDDECLGRTGIFLDSDECGGYEEVRGLARSVGLAFVAQQRPVRPLSHHIGIPFATPWVPERDADDRVISWKRNVYCPQLGYMMGIFSELASLRSDVAWDEGGHATAKHAGYDTQCDRLLQLDYIYHCRPGDPRGHVPVTDFATGGALDVERLLELTEFDAARAVLDAARPVAGPPALLTSFPQRVGRERVSDVALLVHLRRLRNPRSQQLIGRLLAGESYAPLGERVSEMHRAVCVVAALAPNEEPRHLAELVFRKSLETMATLPGSEPAGRYVETYLALAAERIARAQQRVRGGGL